MWLLGYLRYQLRQVLESKVSQVSDMAMKLLCFMALGRHRQVSAHLGLVDVS